NGYGPGEYNDGGWDAPREFTRGRGRGGRNFQGRGRGGYNNGPYVDDQYDGYNQEAPPMQQGR
nr:DNA/RNA-binding protein Alba-like protein [Tanacetum cinerariifolium]